MIYTVFVEHESSIRSFAKIATTSYEKALAAYNDMVDYFSNYCSKGTNFSTRDWEMTGCTTFVACKVIKCDEHTHIIHFDKFEDD